MWDSSLAEAVKDPGHDSSSELWEQTSAHEQRRDQLEPGKYFQKTFVRVVEPHKKYVDILQLQVLQFNFVGN